MANTTDTCTFKQSEVCIATGTPKRNNYFSGKLMTHEHLITEQRYYIDKLKQMNREFTGYGVVNGLVAAYNKTKKTITVGPGIGIDCCGNVLALHGNTKPILKEMAEGDYIYLRFKEEGTGKAARYTKDACSSDCCDDYILENMEIFTDPSHLVVEINDICLNKKDYFSDVLNILKSCGTSEEKILELLENKQLGVIKEMLTKCKVPKDILTRLDNLSEFKAKLPNGEQKNGSFLLLGKYVNKKIDNSYRTELHTNAELSKALCETKNTFTKINSINWEHAKEYTMKLLEENQVSNGSKNSITLIKDTILKDSKRIKNIEIWITEGSGLFQRRKITSFDKSTKVVRISPNWKDGQVPNKASKYILIYNNLQEFEEISKRLQFTFSKAVDKTTIDNKTLNVSTKPYVIANKKLSFFENMQLSLFNFDLPICFDKFEPEDTQKQASFSLLRCYPPTTISHNVANEIEEVKKSVKKEAIYTAVKMRYSLEYSPEGNNTMLFIVAKPENTIDTPKENFTLKMLRLLSNASDFVGIRIHIELKGDFVLDEDGNPIDANHLKGKCPTGNGSAGGTFESWIDIKFDTAILKIFMNILDGIKKQVVAKAPNINEVAHNINLSKEDTQLILTAMENNKVIYRDIVTEKYHPLPDPTRTMIVYDTTDVYLKEEAKKLNERLKEKGISTLLKSSTELTEEDRINYEVILLRGGTLDPDTTNMLTDIPSEIDWDRSEGEIEVIHKINEVNSPIFVIGGKNKDLVAKAVENYVARYSTPKF